MGNFDAPLSWVEWVCSGQHWYYLVLSVVGNFNPPLSWVGLWWATLTLHYLEFSGSVLGNFDPPWSWVECVCSGQLETTSVFEWFCGGQNLHGLGCESVVGNFEPPWLWMSLLWATSNFLGRWATLILQGLESVAVGNWNLPMLEWVCSGQLWSSMVLNESVGNFHPPCTSVCVGQPQSFMVLNVLSSAYLQTMGESRLPPPPHRVIW
jgi:hypothetical protein